MGGGEASPGELPGTDRIPTKQDVLNTGLDPMLLISQQKIFTLEDVMGTCQQQADIMLTVCRNGARGMSRRGGKAHFLQRSWWRRPVYRQGT